MKSFVRLGAAVSVAIATLFSSPAALADASYPSKPIRMLVPNPPGGGTDVLARLLAKSISDQMGQPVVVENKVGGSGFVAADALLQAPADGYTIFMVYSGVLTVNPTLYKGRIRYDPLKDFAPIAPFAEVPNVLVVNESVPARSVKELIALAKAQPGKLSYATSGNGVSNHLAMELFKQMTNIDMTHIPYKGDSPAINDLLGGQVQLMFVNMASFGGQLKNPRVRVLATAAHKRISSVPDLPTVAEAGVDGYGVRLWYGFVTKAGTPEDVVAKLNNAAKVALDSPEVQSRIASMGATPMIQAPAEFRTMIDREIKMWEKVITTGNIVAE
jgi:tripartite-type tricarboxylate transporter receptor subunit TctC